MNLHMESSFQLSLQLFWFSHLFNLKDQSLSLYTVHFALNICTVIWLHYAYRSQGGAVGAVHIDLVSLSQWDELLLPSYEGDLSHSQSPGLSGFILSYAS